MYCIDKKRVFWKKVDHEIVILDIESGIYYTLNDVGAVIWELALESRTLQDIADHLAGHFDVSGDIAYKDAQRIIKELLGENILIEKKGVKHA